MTEFKDIINRIDAYYHEQGYTNDSIAEGIGIDKRTWQNWKSGKRLPDKTNLAGLCDFLNATGGSRFVSLLNGLPVVYERTSEPMTGEIPPGICEEDKNMLIDAFFTPAELQFTCAMTVFQNRAQAVEYVMPGEQIFKKGAFISNWQSAMDRMRKIFGMNDIYEVESLIISNLGECQMPKKKENIEAIGPKALINLINGFLYTTSDKCESRTPLLNVYQIAQEIDDETELTKEEYKNLVDNGYFDENTPFGRFTNVILNIKSDKSIKLSTTDKTHEFIEWCRRIKL